MAVGKTTAVNYLREHAPNVHISFEDHSDVIAEIRRRGLRQDWFDDYIEIQRLWLQKEVERYEKAIRHPCAVMDFGAEEIEFFTLNYPRSVGLSWPVEDALRSELEAVRRCMPARILFLDASDETLVRRKMSDPVRSRNSFDHHLKHLLPLKRTWFLGRGNVDFLNTDSLTADEVGRCVLNWVNDRFSAARQNKN